MQLSTELLKDLNTAIFDSIALPEQDVLLQVNKDLPEGLYLARLLLQDRQNPVDPIKDRDTVAIVINSLRMSIDRPAPGAPGNKRYVRRLDLDVRFEHGGNTFEWKGSTSDRLTTRQLSKLLHEDFPSSIGGDYMTGAPGSKKIIFLTLSLFGTFAILFFVRT